MAGFANSLARGSVRETYLLPLQVSEISPTLVPQHVAIIMDGNGRWANQRHMPRTFGHARGAAVVRALVEYSARVGIKCLTLFAFSTENWRRPTDEVSTLMGLFVQYLEKEMRGLADAGVRLKVIGDLAGLPSGLVQRINAAEEATADNKTITLCVAANYGGRWDLVQAVKVWQAVNPKSSVAELTEQGLAQFLSTSGMPDVDLLIRSGGERRISNFLLWQVAYAELYFTDVLWPDFEPAELGRALDWYAGRERRFGTVITEA